MITIVRTIIDFIYGIDGIRVFLGGYGVFLIACCVGSWVMVFKLRARG